MGCLITALFLVQGCGLILPEPPPYRDQGVAGEEAGESVGQATPSSDLDE